MNDKAKHLRALYRNGGEQSYPKVKAEYERLFPDREIPLDHILMTAWEEGRELSGQHYDKERQDWIGKDGRSAE